MVDWEDPAVLNTCSILSEKLSLFIFGIFCWHFLTTLKHVEMRLLTGTLKWQWAYLFYLCGRYLMIVNGVMFQAPLTQASFEVVVLTGSIIVLCATGNLLLRTMTIWRRTTWMWCLLGLAGFGQWTVMIVVSLVPMVVHGQGFALGASGPSLVRMRYSLPFYLYTSLFDLMILVATIVGLYRQQAAKSSPLWTTLYSEGILYFAATLLVNVPLLVFNWLDLNSIMSGMFSGPSLMVSVIASSRAVISLLLLKDDRKPSYLPTLRVQEQAGTTNMVLQHLSTHINLTSPVYDSQPDLGSSASKPEDPSLRVPENE